MQYSFQINHQLMNTNNPNIAIVHDWFINNSIGGAEKVTKLIYENVSRKFTEPDIFALVENISSSKQNLLSGKKIKTSFLQKLPFGITKIQHFLPLIPFAIEQLDLRQYDLVISSSHVAAKGVLTSPDQLHISYIHTPMRYAWDQMEIYLEKSSLSRMGMEYVMRYFLYKLREWDVTSAKRSDHLIANSNFTHRRIKKYWGLDSNVIHPPVDVKRFHFNEERGDFYLSVNRLVPNKRVDILIKAFNKLGLPLKIVGKGPELSKLKKLGKSNIEFYDQTSNQVVEELMSKCRGFVYAGIEDFGIAPIEAMASGSPVIALSKGGITDSVSCIKDNSGEELPTGLLFKNQTSEDLVEAITWFEDKKAWRTFDPENLNNYAQKFNHENFNQKFNDFINIKFESFKRNKQIL